MFNHYFGREKEKFDEVFGEEILCELDKKNTLLIFQKGISWEGAYLLVKSFMASITLLTVLSTASSLVSTIKSA